MSDSAHYDQTAWLTGNVGQDVYWHTDRNACHNQCSIKISEKGYMGQ